MRKINNKKNPKVISLFAGCGGLDLGFKQAGFKIVWANEIDQDAARTYSKFVGDHIIVKDIEDALDEIPKADIVIGGPPCQSFSLVGKRINDDPRGKLVLSFLKVIAKIRPKVFIMENVPGLMSSNFNSEKVHLFLHKEYEKIGYKVELFHVNAVDFCVPQKRKRVFMIGHNFKGKKFSLIKKDEFKEKILGLKGVGAFVNSKDALSDLPKATWDKNKIISYEGIDKSKYAKLMREGSNGKLTLHFVPTMSKQDKEYIKHIPPGGNYSHIPDEISTKRIMYFKKTGGRTTTYGRLDPTKPSYTINTYFNRPNVGANYHYSEKRLITPREGLRLQSFPDYFTPLYKSQRSLYKQIGNAVPPLMARGIAESIKKLFND